MIRFLEYSILFIVLVLLQIFIFNGIQFSNLVTISVYILFIILLPNNIGSTMLLLSSALLGFCIDLTTGTSGIHAMATTFIAFIRPALVKIFIGSDEDSLNAIPSSSIIGSRRFINFTVGITLIFNTILFLLEALSLNNILFTILRIIVSSIAASFFIYIIQLAVPFTKKANS